MLTQIKKVGSQEQDLEISSLFQGLELEIDMGSLFHGLELEIDRASLFHGLELDGAGARNRRGLLVEPRGASWRQSTWRAALGSVGGGAWSRWKRRRRASSTSGTGTWRGGRSGRERERPGLATPRLYYPCSCPPPASGATADCRGAAAGGRTEDGKVRRFGFQSAGQICKG